MSSAEEIREEEKLMVKRRASIIFGSIGFVWQTRFFLTKILFSNKK